MVFSKLGAASSKKNPSQLNLFIVGLLSHPVPINRLCPLWARRKPGKTHGKVASLSLLSAVGPALALPPRTVSKATCLLLFGGARLLCLPQPLYFGLCPDQCPSFQDDQAETIMPPPHNVDVCKFCRRALTLMNFFQFQIVGNRLLPCPWTFLGSRHHVQTGQGSRHGECARPQSFTPLHLLV